jgi:hypothetical protein
LGAFNHRARTGRPRYGFALGPRTKNLLASCYLGLQWSKSFERRG